jgi:putative ABC transport system permease protein
MPGRNARRYTQTYEGLIEKLRALPGVRNAAGANSIPLQGGMEEAYPFRVDGKPDNLSPVPMKFFLPGYFQTMNIPIVEGSGFSPTVRPEMPNPVAISEALARRLFPGESAIGKQILRLDSDGTEVEMSDTPIPPWTIAGVVSDVHEETLRADAAEMVYIPIVRPYVELSIVPIRLTLTMRTDVPPLSVAPAVRQIIRDFDPTLSVARIRTMEEIVATSAARERFLAGLLFLAAATSLFLGTIGIYSVVAEAVRRRQSEIGIRIALGAQPTQVAKLVLKEAFGIVTIGLVAGIISALAMTRFLRSLLFGITPTDPLTLLAAITLLTAVAVFASVVPARRAVRTDPMTALRAE